MTLTQDRRTELIGGCPLFRGIDAAGLGAIAGAAIEVDFPADRVIARQGEIGTGFFVVVDGMVRVIRDGAVVARLGPGEFFGELSVLDGGPRVAQVDGRGPDPLPRARVVGLRARAARGAGRRAGGPAGGGRPPPRGHGGPPNLIDPARGSTVAAIDRPTGDVTFLFTDIEGSTRLVDALGTAAWRPILARHREIIRARAGGARRVREPGRGRRVLRGVRRPGRRGGRRSPTCSARSPPSRGPTGR